MSVQVKLRRDTALFLSTFTGADGELLVDTTAKRIQVHDGATAGGFPSPVALSVQNGGDTNNSNVGSGTDFDHNLTFSIPASFMIARRAFRVTATFLMNSGVSPPNITFKLKLGTIVTSANAAVAPTPSVSNGTLALQWIFQAIAAPGASVNVQTAMLGVGSSPNTPLHQNMIAQPVAIATNAAQILKITTLWSAAGIGANTIALSQFIVEALN